jgi:hypothetical protein
MGKAVCADSDSVSMGVYCNGPCPLCAFCPPVPNVDEKGLYVIGETRGVSKAVMRC